MKRPRRTSYQRRRFQVYRPHVNQLARPWLLPVTALAVVILGGAIGYRITEGWDWGDCLWMVLITISTIGYGEVEPLSQAGRLVTVLIVAGGIVVVQLSIQKILGLTESGYFRQLRELRFRRNLRRMNDHVILCGYGRIGREIAEQLLIESVPVLVVELDSARRKAAEERGLPVLQADATLDETLLEAGLDRWRSLGAALPPQRSCSSTAAARLQLGRCSLAAAMQLQLSCSSAAAAWVQPCRRSSAAALQLQLGCSDAAAA